ncbi:hypothetical protein HW555_004322 [Spodoptera exigua]|uniref:Uncharacterized protein n=1 Tax=Spodoptera exigua TaxID=7107 RepID=A0A835GM72_SPOEX|nr:hypothetical protein HW555_004322 [Spodoptera exigua]
MTVCESKKKKVEEEVTIDLVDDDNTENVGVPGAAMQDAEKNDQVPEDEFGAKDYRVKEAACGHGNYGFGNDFQPASSNSIEQEWCGLVKFRIQK